jgi:hypothetical protein
MTIRKIRRRRLSAVTRRRMSIAHRGRPLTAHHERQISRGMLRFYKKAVRDGR